jgi:hypothetical protein
VKEVEGAPPLKVEPKDWRQIEPLEAFDTVAHRFRVVADRPARELLADAALLEAHGLEKPLSLR